MSGKTSEEIFDMSTELLDSLSTREDVEPAEAIILLVLTLGRLMGGYGKLELDLDEHWNKALNELRPFFDYGFNVERDEGLEESEEEPS